ncbi:general substrate transporter [Aspergillus insuetus]
MWASFNREKYWGLKGRWLTFWITVACAADMALFGYDQGVFGGVIVTEDFLSTFYLKGPEHTSLLGTVTAIYDVGCFFGAITAVYIGERLGRRRSILCGTVTMSIGAILQASAYGVPQLIIGRIVSGLGNGINTATAPTWQGETSHAKWRGKLVLLEMVFNIAGYSLSNWLTLGFSYVPGSASWRFPLAFQFFFIFIILGTVIWLPESPRWLIKRDRLDEASQIIADIADRQLDDAEVVATVADIRSAVLHENQHRISWSGIFSRQPGGAHGTSTVRRLVLGMTAQAMSQLSGINVTSYYLPTVLMQSVGLTESLARVLTACNSVSYLIAGCVSLFAIERLGRRQLLMICSAGQSFCYLMITILICFSGKAKFTSQSQVASASVAFFFSYYVFFACGFQGIPWLYPVEINSLVMRTKGAALGSATNWALNFMVVEITPIGVQNLGWRFYIIWTVFNASFIPLVYFFFPETADRTLEDIDRFFQENPGIFVHKNVDGVARRRPERYVWLAQEARSAHLDMDDLKEIGGDKAVVQHEEDS